MKALSFWQPWDHVVVRGLKPVENRSWAPPSWMWGQRLAVHRAARFDLDGDAFVRRTLQNSGDRAAADLVPKEALPSAVVGVVTVLGYARLSPTKTLEGSGGLPARFGLLEAHELAESPWAFGPYAWALVDAVALAEPVPCKGRQGLWVLPVEVEAAVRRQLERRTP